MCFSFLSWPTCWALHSYLGQFELLNFYGFPLLSPIISKKHTHFVSQLFVSFLVEGDDDSRIIHGSQLWYVELHILAADTNCTLVAMYMSLRCNAYFKLSNVKGSCRTYQYYSDTRHHIYILICSYFAERYFKFGCNFGQDGFKVK